MIDKTKDKILLTKDLITKGSEMRNKLSIVIVYGSFFLIFAAFEIYKRININWQWILSLLPVKLFIPFAGAITIILFYALIGITFFDYKKGRKLSFINIAIIFTTCLIWCLILAIKVFKWN